MLLGTALWPQRLLAGCCTPTTGPLLADLSHTPVYTLPTGV